MGASGKLGQYMIEHALARGYEVFGVCREQSIDKLARFEGRITVVPGFTNERDVIRRAVSNCDAVLTVLAPWGVQRYASGTAQAVLDFAPAHARLAFSCGWHISLDGKDVYPRRLLAFVKVRPAGVVTPSPSSDRLRPKRTNQRRVPADLECRVPTKRAGNIVERPWRSRGSGPHRADLRELTPRSRAGGRSAS